VGGRDRAARLVGRDGLRRAAATQQRREGDVKLKDGQIIGLVQCFALVPGGVPVGRHDLGRPAA
jgi:hypothetical protein